jgi:predicted DNA binding CopG/RHH family protein
MEKAHAAACPVLPPSPHFNSQGDRMTTKTKELKTRVSEETKADFIKLAENHGLTESELLRLIITTALSNQEPQITPKEKEIDIEITELKIRLPKFLIEQAKAKAKTQGMATTRWIKSLVQSNLIQPPVLTDSAIIALKETYRELAAVGNNLNQIARKLNESIFKIEMVKIEKLEEVKKEVKSVRAAIDELIKVSRNGWSINHD